MWIVVYVKDGATGSDKMSHVTEGDDLESQEGVRCYRVFLIFHLLANGIY